MTPAAPVRSAAPRWWLAALAGVCVFALVAAGALWRLHRDTLDAQARELELLSLALSDELARGLEGAEEGLRAVRAGWTAGRLAPSGAETERSLRVRAELMPLVQSLWMIETEGRLLAASDPSPLPARDSFAPALATLPPDGTAVSTPFGSPPLIALAVHVPSRGWVIASMPSAALLGAFTATSTVADARMTVRRGDGTVLAGEALPAGPGRLEQRRHVARFGLDVVLSRDTTAALAGWRESAQLAGAAAVLLGTVLALSWRFVQRADRRRAEAQQALQLQRARASKLESLGTMAGGVAHDFNNVLAAIVGFGEMAQDTAPAGSDQARHLDKVLQAASRGQALVARILAFSRGGARASTVFALQPVVEEVLALLAGSLRPGVVLETDLEAADARVRGDATRVFEAVMNLCTNAMQAMPDGGTLAVRLVRHHTHAPTVLSHASLPAGDHVALSVSDGGAGIPPDVMERLFEPFFTTRADGGGTGLGLAVVHGVVSEFGGAVDVRSAPGRGARFTLYLPESTDEADRSPEGARPPRRGAGEQVLVVDDEPALVEMMMGLLSGLGYAPAGFTDPLAALAAVRAAPGTFAAVVSDEVMPGLSGTELAAAVNEADPGLPVLLVTGHGGALLAQRAARSGVDRVLGKPLRRAELAEALSDLIG
ncbi:MAG: ATP-binding protein [Rhizobacter sp.]